MEILLPGSTPKLDKWEQRPFAKDVELGPRPEDHRDLYERIVATELPGPPDTSGAHLKLAAAILRYEIFPPAIVKGLLRRVPVQKGDTVGILYQAAGLVQLFFAARVIDVFDGQLAEATGAVWRTGFTYRTLDGHPELGEETFAVEKNLVTGAVRVFLSSWSRPGTALARTFAPVVRKLQVHASHAALDHLGALAHSVDAS
jgi:uncharacterized protein (UPF0548 family)